MSNYRCIRSFKNALGTNFSYGQIITASRYYLLTVESRRNFEEIIENSGYSSSNSSGSDSYSPPSDLGSSFSSWDSSSDSSSSFDSNSFDFGGGDGGGGGSTGDW